jgi:ATP-dependent Lon protease
MATAIASALIRLPVRKSVAMTGEITLRGKVLPIGGLKEKLLAAHRAGIPTVLIPKENEKDIKDIPATVLKKVKPVFVGHMDEVLCAALNVKGSEEIFKGGAKDEAAKDAPAGAGVAVPNGADVVRH